MKRYAMGFFQGAPAMFEQPEGDYVKWSDVRRYPKPDLSGCEVMVDGEGIELESNKPFSFTCCDCGLTHRCVIVSEDGKPVGFAVERMNTPPAYEVVYFRRTPDEPEDSLRVPVGTAEQHIRGELITRIVPALGVKDVPDGL